MQKGDSIPLNLRLKREITSSNFTCEIFLLVKYYLVKYSLGLIFTFRYKVNVHFAFATFSGPPPYLVVGQVICWGPAPGGGG